MAYEQPSDEARSRKLRSELSVVRNIALFQNAGINTDVSGFGAGARDTPRAVDHGMQAWMPVKHTYTTDGASRNHITLQASAVIVTGAGSVINLHYIDGTINDGQIISIRPDLGKTLVLKKATTLDNTTGNLNLDADLTINDHQIAILQFHSDQGTAGGMYVLLVSSGGGGGSNLWSAITIDVTKDMAQKGLTNLDFIAFNTAITSYINGIAGTGINYDVPTGETHRLLINGVLQYEFNNTTLNMLNKSLFNLNDILFNEAGQFILSDANGLHHLVPTGDVIDFLINGLPQMTINPNAINIKGIEFVASNRLLFGNSGIAGIRVDVPSGETFQVQIGSVDKFRVNAGNIDLFGSSINNLNDILFAVSGQSILSDTSGIDFLVPTGDNFEWLINGVLQMRLTNISLLMSTAIDLNSFGLLNAGSIAMSDPNMIINDTAGIFSFDVGATQKFNFSRGGVLLFELASTSRIRSSNKVLLQVTSAGNSIVFHDNTSDRITYDWSTDDFYPVDGQSDLGRATNRWHEVFAQIGTINTSFTRFKTNIKQVDNDKCLEIVKALKPIKYKMKADPNVTWKDKKKEKKMKETVYFGFAADPLENLCPEACSKDDSGYNGGVYLHSIVAALCGAVTKLDERIQRLENPA
jgi:hypothetical protein